MIKIGRSLTKSLKYFYNNKNDWRRFSKRMPLAADELKLKTHFKTGDHA